MTLLLESLNTTPAIKLAMKGTLYDVLVTYLLD